MGEVGSNTKDGPVTLEQIDKKIDTLKKMVRLANRKANMAQILAFSVFSGSLGINLISMMNDNGTISIPYLVGGTILIFIAIYFVAKQNKYSAKFDEKDLLEEV